MPAISELISDANRAKLLAQLGALQQAGEMPDEDPPEAGGEPA